MFVSFLCLVWLSRDLSMMSTEDTMMEELTLEECWKSMKKNLYSRPSNLGGGCADSAGNRTVEGKFRCIGKRTKNHH
jgi:hypothetical protein